MSAPGRRNAMYSRNADDSGDQTNFFRLVFSDDTSNVVQNEGGNTAIDGRKDAEKGMEHN